MDNVEQILLKMLPGKEERYTYTVFYLQSKWKSICGENVARHSKPVKLENKVLYINTDSSVWSNHLLLMKKQFIIVNIKIAIKFVSDFLKRRNLFKTVTQMKTNTAFVFCGNAGN